MNSDQIQQSARELSAGLMKEVEKITQPLLSRIDDQEQLLASYRYAVEFYPFDQGYRAKKLLNGTIAGKALLDELKVVWPSQRIDTFVEVKHEHGSSMGPTVIGVTGETTLTMIDYVQKYLADKLEHFNRGDGYYLFKMAKQRQYGLLIIDVVDYRPILPPGIAPV